jgi:hypothetical protein
MKLRAVMTKPRIVKRVSVSIMLCNSQTN